MRDGASRRAETPLSERNIGHGGGRRRSTDCEGNPGNLRESSVTEEGGKTRGEANGAEVEKGEQREIFK